MKTLIAFLFLAATTLFAFPEESKIPSGTKIGDYVQLPDAAGFLQYSGEHAGVRVCALSQDIGSAVPSENFHLYVMRDSGCTLILSLPFLGRKGYSCSIQGDELSVHVSPNYRKKPEANSKPVMVINLSQLVNAYTEKGGTDQPGTAPQLKPDGNQKPKPEREVRHR